MKQDVRRWMAGALTALVGLVAASPAYAVPNSWIANGAQWTLTGDAGTGDFTLSLDTVDWDMANVGFLANFSFKNWGSDITGFTLTDAPGGIGDWNSVHAGLNANGCKAGTTADAVCVFDTDPYAVTTGEGLSYSWDFSIALTDAFPDFTHLKVRWVDDTGKKIGSLISENISWVDNNEPPGRVPEPGSLALLGIGLVGLGYSRRRRRGSRSE